jgi:hypothetical protein
MALNPAEGMIDSASPTGSCKQSAARPFQSGSLQSGVV